MCSAELAPKVDKAVFPGLQGGPLMHVIAGKAVALGHALTPEFRARQEAIVHNCRRSPTSCSPGGVALVSGGTDNHLVLVDLSATPLTGQDGEDRLDARRHHGQQERRPVRRAPADGHLRPAHRHRRPHHPRPARARDARDRPDHRRGPATRGRAASDLEALRARSRAIGDRFPLYPRLHAGTAV